MQQESSDRLSGPFLVGSLISCTATPNDGKEDGDSVNDSTTIMNTEPTLDSVAISPLVMTSGEMATLSKVGSVFMMVVLSLTLSPSSLPSFGVAVQEIKLPTRNGPLSLSLLSCCNSPSI